MTKIGKSDGTGGPPQELPSSEEQSLPKARTLDDADRSRFVLPSAPATFGGPMAQRAAWARAVEASDAHHDRLPTPEWVSLEDLDTIKRLCRGLSGNRWRDTYGAFLTALVKTCEHENQRVVVAASHAPDPWWHKPWLSLLAANPKDTDHPTPESLIAHATKTAIALGFANVAIPLEIDPRFTQRSPEPLHVPRASAHVCRALEEAKAAGVHIAVGLRLRHQGPHPTQGAAPDLCGPEFLLTLLLEIGGLLQDGFSAVIAHEADQWILSALTHETSPKTHALIGLIKLFLRFVADESVLIVEERGRSKDPLRFFGARLALRAHEMTAQADVLFWHRGARALLDALVSRRRAPLDAETQAIPTVVYGACWVACLDDPAARTAHTRKTHATPAPPNDAFLHDPKRLALELACLYALPATPFVGIDAPNTDPQDAIAWDVLKKLNQERATEPALAAGATHPLGHGLDDVIAWAKASDHGRGVLFVANLSDAPRTVHLIAKDLRIAWRMQADAPMALRPIVTREANVDSSMQTVCPESEGKIEIELEPFGFRLYAAQSALSAAR